MIEGRFRSKLSLPPSQILLLCRELLRVERRCLSATAAASAMSWLRLGLTLGWLLVACEGLITSMYDGLLPVRASATACKPRIHALVHRTAVALQRTTGIHMSEQPIAAKRKVVVTGLGTVTSLGHDAHTFFDNLLEGKCGIQPIARFDSALHQTKIAAEVRDFDVSQYWEPKDAKRHDRYSHLAMAAAKIALKDGALDPTSLKPKRFGVLVGSGVGGLQSVETSCEILMTKGPKRITPFLLPSLIGNIAGSMIAIDVNAQGPNYGIVSACATGTHAIGEALKYIQYGEADVMLAGGSEATVTPLGFAGFNSMRAMCTTSNDSPQTASRPFDANRAGFVMGEGAGVLLLESEEHALARGAHIYCELAGYAATCDAHHITAPHPEGEGMAECLHLAMDAAGVTPEQVQYINAHGTSTPLNDKFETMAYKRVFGDHAYKIKISSTKGATGHLLGAAGGVEAAICCKVLQTNNVPPTINYETPDPDCDLDYVPNVKYVAEKPIDVVLSDNLGFGGHNAALVFKRYSGGE